MALAERRRVASVVKRILGVDGFVQVWPSRFLVFGLGSQSEKKLGCKLKVAWSEWEKEIKKTL